MRDEEVRIPNGCYDVWEKVGKNQDHAYSWDMQTNTNLNFQRDGFLPRCRFDRLDVRPATSLTVNFKLISFKLQGLAMIPSINRYTVYQTTQHITMQEDSVVFFSIV